MPSHTFNAFIGPSLPEVGTHAAFWMTPLLWYQEGFSWVLAPVSPLPSLFQPTEPQMAFLWNLAFGASLGWIVYRIYEIYQKPVAELCDALGIDIPPLPDVSLAGITSDSVLLYWKPPENYHSTLRHYVQVNGINVGEFDRADASIQVTGLKPGCYYSIRAIATNSSGFSSLGHIIRIRTIPLTGHEQSKNFPVTTGDSESTLLRATSSHEDHSAVSLAHHVTRDHAGGQTQGKRVASGRRSSPAINGNGQSNVHMAQVGNGDEEEETIPYLTRKLDSLRRQQEELDRQMAEEEEEFEKSKAALIKERDRLRHVLKEKEEAADKFRKQVNELEKLSKATQRKKSAKERLLQQKRAERQKMKDDIERWNREIIEMRKDTEALLEEKARIDKDKEEKVAHFRKIIYENNAANKLLEEDIRIKGMQIKVLEKEREQSDSGHNTEEQEFERRERAEEQAHESRMQEYQTQYKTLWQALQQAEADNQLAQEKLQYWTAKRARDPSQFGPLPGFESFSSTVINRQRRVRQGTSRTSTVSAGHPIGSSAFNSISSISPSFSSISPFFNMSNGMAVPAPIDRLNMSLRVADVLTGGAPMSPTADMLLPSNLLRDDDPPSHELHNDSCYETVGDLVTDPFFARRPSSTGVNTHGPHSPVSLNSRSPSIFSSPHDSLHNLHGYHPGAEPFAESDRQSVHSTSSPFASGVAANTNPIAARRLAGFFNFSRQRGKSSANEPPLLGSLKQGQSQSFPRNVDQASLGPLDSGRRRVSSGTWANPMANLLARNTSASNSLQGDRPVATRTGTGRRSRLNMFGSKLEPFDATVSFDRPPSPRPSSTYSFENALPWPSTDSQPFGWSMPDGHPNRSSPLGVNWSALGNPWSRNQSRRASVQHGSSSNLSLGSTPLDLDDYQSAMGRQVSPPAPIGTERLQASQRPVTPKLNPAAPSFKTRFFSRSDVKKVEKGEKPDKAAENGTEKSKNKDVEKPKDKETDSTYEESSPPNSRLSKDARSIGTATSMAESHESLEHSTSGTPSETHTPCGTKETLMQRITRKSSSSKFNVPWSKDRSSLFSKRNGEPSTPGEIDEDGSSEGQLTKTVDSVSSTPQHEKGNRGSISWPNLMRKSKKGDKATTESGWGASETETGDDDEV